MSQKTQTNGDPSICARCHAQGGGCCQLRGRGSEGMFGLTVGEIEIMARASGLTSEAFVVSDRAGEAFLAGARKIHPIFGQTMPHGFRLRLRLEPDGSCCFLGPGGCALPGEARPLYCRLYPFWFTPGGRLMVMGAPDCLAQRGARNCATVLARMGQDEATLRRLFGRLEQLAARHQMVHESPDEPPA